MNSIYKILQIKNKNFEKPINLNNIITSLCSNKSK